MTHWARISSRRKKVKVPNKALILEGEAHSGRREGEEGEKKGKQTESAERESSRYSFIAICPQYCEKVKLEA
jgi:hypothetical protein